MRRPAKLLSRLVVMLNGRRTIAELGALSSIRVETVQCRGVPNVGLGKLGMWLNPLRNSSSIGTRCPPSLLGVALAVWALASNAAPAPVPKSGPCPVGYRTNGDYCVPTESTPRSTKVVPKIGTCPIGYRSDGNYCVASRPSPPAGAAVPKSGQCPIGYRSDGKYCISSGKEPPPSKAVLKNGQCPVGYRTDGAYCVSRSASDPPGNAVPRSGQCPVGYRVDGNYCVSKK